MLIIIWAGLILAGILRPKSKIITFLMIAFMIVTIGYSTQGSDFIIYKNEYTWAAYQTSADVHYVGYLVIEQWGHQAGLTFEQFRLIVAVVSCLLLYFGIKPMTENINFVYSFYLIYPFGHEAIQVRTFLANAIFIFLFTFALNALKDKGVKRILKLILFYGVALIGCTMHFQAVFYLAAFTALLFLPKKYTVEQVFFLSFVVFLLIQTNILSGIIGAMNSRASYWLSSKTGLGIVIPIALTLFIWWLTQYSSKTFVKYTVNMGLLEKTSNSSECVKTLMDRKELVDSFTKFSDYILLIIPLFCYDITFNRLWRLFLVILYVIISYVAYYKVNSKVKDQIFVLLIGLLIFTVVYENEFSLLFNLMDNNAVFGKWSVF